MPSYPRYPEEPWEPLSGPHAPSQEAIVAHQQVGLPTGKLTVWANSTYEVIVTERAPFLFHYSINRYDRQPIVFWRHIQQIKNEIAGEDAEAIQLFPSEARLVDGANQYHIWVITKEALDGMGGVSLPFDNQAGFIAIGDQVREVTTDEEADDWNAAPHPGRQEPWQPGLRSGEIEHERRRDQDDQDRRGAEDPHPAFRVT